MFNLTKQTILLLLQTIPMIRPLVILFLFLSSISFSQQLEYEGSLELQGFYASEGLPFWMYTNSSTRANALTNVFGYAFAKAQYDLNEASNIQVGVGIMYRDGFVDRFERNELFVSYTNKWLLATVGTKNPSEAYDGLSTSNGNILWSGNNRAIPGITLESPKALNIGKIFTLDYGIGHYLLNDDRYVSDTRIHYKKLGLGIKVDDKHSFKGTIQHYAQWGGTHPTLGELPSGFSDFTKVIFAQNAGDNAEFNERVNALGNHLGSFDFEYKYKGETGTLTAYHLHLFEDGSGTAFKNFPDGIWGVTYAPKDKKLKRILYEYVNTTDQSSGEGRSAGDNYFSNKGYRSGWTYEGNTIGLPFILLNPETGLGISNNLIKAYHLGAFFTFDKLNVQVKLSAVDDAGSPSNPLEISIKKLYTYAKAHYITDYGNVSLLLGADTNSITKSTVGVGVGYQYNF